MTLFNEIPLADKDYFRAVILYGANVASYKFALAESIIGIAAEGEDFATLTDLALPFSDALCRHLGVQDKQTTSRTSRFLDMLRGFNRGEIDIDEKIDSTARLGFVNVIDAFHVVHAKEIPVRFFHDERKLPQPGIRLTDELLKMAADVVAPPPSTRCAQHTLPLPPRLCVSRRLPLFAQRHLLADDV